MPAVDVTENYIRMRQKDPGDFQEDSMRTMVLDAAGGIHAVIGKLKGKATTEVQSYLFEKDKWDVDRAKAWVEKHKGGYRSKEWAARASQYPGNPRLTVRPKGTAFALFADDGKPDPVGVTFEQDVVLFAEGETSAPTEFLIVPRGDWSTTKYGTIKVTDRSIESVMAHYAERGMERLPIDWEHQTYKSGENGKDAPAAGWFKLEAREDGLWAVDVEWTDKARAQIEAREYRHFSPTGRLDTETNELLTITTIALTNVPATNGQTPLAASDDQGAPQSFTDPADAGKEQAMLAKLKEALGLKPDATEDECLAAIVALGVKNTEAATNLTAKDEEIATLKAKPDAAPLVAFRASAMESVGLKADAPDTEFVAAVEVLKAQAPEAAKVVELQVKIADAEKFREDIRIERLMASVDDYVTPANKANVEKLARVLDEAQFKATVEQFPRVKGAPTAPISAAALDERNGAEGTLTPEDREYLAAARIAEGSDKWKAFETEKKRMAEEKSKAR